MDKKQIPTSLNDLRKGSDTLYNKVDFKKAIVGGYDIKEVNDYVKSLKESLHTAEKSFNNRIEEYASISAMHTQEIDNYIKMIKSIENEKEHLNKKIKEIENETNNLNAIIADIQSKSNDESKIYEMQSIIDDLKSQIDIYKKNEDVYRNYDAVAAENDLLKKNYEQTMTENSMLVADKNVLTEKIDRLSDTLLEANDRNKELREINTKIKLKIRKDISEIQGKIFESSQKRQQNIEQLTELISKAMNIVEYENENIKQIIESSEKEIVFEFESNEEN